MIVLQRGLDLRCGRRLPAWTETLGAQPHVVIVHGGDQTEHVIGDGPDGASELARWLSQPQCAGVLLMRGEPYAGIGKTRSEELHRVTRGRVHVLSYAIHPAEAEIEVSPLVRERMARFFAKLEMEDDVDWRLVDPEWNEAVVAAYLVLAAARVIASKRGPGRELLRDPIVLRLLELAKEEIAMTTGDILTIPDELTVARAGELEEALCPYVASQLEFMQ